jgi:hypothetical protein
MTLKIPRRSILTSLLALVPASLLPASLKMEPPPEQKRKRPFKFYPEPKTTFDAFMWIVDHKAQLNHGFNPFTGIDNLCISVNGWYVAFQHDCTKPTKLEDYAAEFILPCVISLHRELYRVE